MLRSVQIIKKKDDPFVKKNYWPVGILTAHAKIFEDIMFIQLTEHFNNIFHNYLAAFRKELGCATTLLRLAGDWKKERLFLVVPRGCLRFVIVVFPDHIRLIFLVNQQYVSAVLMDLSKAFDFLSHDLILASLVHIASLLMHVTSQTESRGC